MKQKVEIYLNKERNSRKRQKIGTSMKTIKMLLRICVLSIIKIGIFQITNYMYFRSLGIMAATFSESSHCDPSTSSSPMEERLKDTDKQNDTQIFETIFKRDDSQRDDNEIIEMNKNIKFFVKNEMNPCGKLCNGIHSKTPQPKDLHENSVTDFTEEWMCSEGTSMDSHIPIESHKFIYDKNKIRFEMLELQRTHHQVDKQQELYLLTVISSKSFKYFEKLLDFNSANSLYNIPLESFTEILLLLGYLTPNPCKNFDEFLKILYKKSIFYYKNFDICFKQENSFFSDLFSEEPMECNQTESENCQLKINDGSEEMKQDLRCIKLREDKSTSLIHKGCYEWAFGAYLSIFGLSLQYYDGLLTIQKQTNQIFSSDLFHITIQDNFNVRIIRGSFFNLSIACKFQENIDILSFFFRNKKVWELELTDLEYEPTVVERHIQHDQEIIKIQHKNEFPEEIGTREVVLKLMQIPVFREIEVLKIKNVDLHAIDVNALYDLKNLKILEVTSASEEIKRGIGKIIRQNKYLECISLESVLLSEILLNSLKNSAPKEFIIKNCKPYESDELLNAEFISLSHLFEDRDSLFTSQLSKLEILSKKNLNPFSLSHLKNLKVLKLISCLRDGVISLKMLESISEMQNLEELNLSGNMFYSDFEIGKFSSMVCLSKLELVDCGIDFSSAFSANLDKIEWKCPLRELNLSKNQSQYVFLFINCFPELKVLNLSEFHVDNCLHEKDRVEVSLPKNLKVLKLERLKNAFFRRFKLENLNQIETLSLRDSSLKNSKNFLENFTEKLTLTRLDLSSCRLTRTEVYAIRAFKKITHLFLYDTEFEDMNINEFLSQISKTALLLKEIYISNVNLIIKNVRLMSSLRNFVCLKKIFLYSVSIPSESFDRSELSAFSNLEIFSLGYDEKFSCESEIEKLKYCFKFGVLKTFKIHSKIVLTYEKK